MNCKKHEPVWLMPAARDLNLDDDRQLTYAIDVSVLHSLNDYVVCKNCMKTGHVIKSHRSGIRWHYDGSRALERAYRLAKEYGFVIPFIKEK